MRNFFNNHKVFAVSITSLLSLVLLAVISLGVYQVNQQNVYKSRAAEIGECRTLGQTCGSGSGANPYCCVGLKCSTKDDSQNCVPRSKRKISDLIPAKGVLMGIYPAITRSSQRDGEPKYSNDRKRDVEVIEKAVGRTFDLDLTYIYGSDPDKFPTIQNLDDQKNGRIPVIGLGAIDTIKIITGDKNVEKKYRKAAQSFKKYSDTYGDPVFVRYGSEVNLLPSFATSGNIELDNKSWLLHNCKDENDPCYQLDAYRFRQAWRRVREIFKQEGANNIIWVWTVGVGRQFTTPADSQMFYPGDDYVDWIGLNGYDHGEGDFREIFKEYYRYWTRPGLKSIKPIMLSETGVAAINPGPDMDKYRTEWFRKMQDHLSEYPQVKAVVYWSGFARDKESATADWRLPIDPKSLEKKPTLDTTKESFKAFKTMVRDPYFNVLNIDALPNKVSPTFVPTTVVPTSIPTPTQTP